MGKGMGNRLKYTKGRAALCSKKGGVTNVRLQQILIAAQRFKLQFLRKET